MAHAGQRWNGPAVGAPQPWAMHGQPMPGAGAWGVQPMPYAANGAWQGQPNMPQHMMQPGVPPRPAYPAHMSQAPSHTPLPHPVPAQASHVQPSLSQPVLTQPIAHPTMPSQAPAQPAPSSTQPAATPLPATQPPSQSDLEQKKRERDKREKERKEREQRKQREIEMQKREAHKKQQIVAAAAAVSKEPRQINLLKKPTEFLCNMQFRNRLPDIPFDPKLLTLPLDSLRYTRCITGSSLENSYKHTLWTEPDLGIPINLIDPSIYRIPPGAARQLAPEDQALVDANAAGPARKVPGAVASLIKERHRPSVTWLRRTNYLCNEEDLPQFKARGVESQPAAYKLQKAGSQRDLNSLEGQIRAVEDTFEAVKRTPVHPNNPAIKAVEVLPIFPDFTLWSNSYTEVVFDADPLHTLSSGKLESLDDEEKDYMRNKAVVRGIPNAHQLVAYITPTRKRGREEEDEEEEYEQIYAFHFDVAKDADLKDNYFFVFTPEAVYYNELGTRVKLRKVQSKEEKEQLLSIPRPDSVWVSKEEMGENTKMERAERLTEMLQPASAEEAADM